MADRLFDHLPRTRKRRVMMHVVDAGPGCEDSDIVRLECKKCGHDTGWAQAADPWYLDKRGRPCPICNAEDS